MSTNSAIAGLTQALDCAGKCDCCDKLQQQINTLNNQVAQIPRVNINAIIDQLKIALVPVIGGIVVQQTTPLSQQLKGQIATARTGIIQDVETDINRAMQKATADTLDSIKTNYGSIEQRLANAERVANEANSLANTSLNKAANVENKLAQTAQEIELSKSLSNQAKNEATNATTQVERVSGEVAQSSRVALDAANDVNGLRGAVNGLGSRLNSFGQAIARMETAVGNAVEGAAHAVGISSEALAATGRLAGKVLEAFNVIGTIFTILDGKHG